MEKIDSIKRQFGLEAHSSVKLVVIVLLFGFCFSPSLVYKYLYQTVGFSCAMVVRVCTKKQKRKR